MATGDRVDPYRNFNFLVEIDGITQAGFSDVSGFGASTDPIEYREGGEPNNTVRKLPGVTKWNNITLKWGLTDSRELFDWYQAPKPSTSSATRAPTRPRCASWGRSSPRSAWLSSNRRSS